MRSCLIRSLAVVLAAAGSLEARAQAAPNTTEAAIRSLLQQQVDAWNRHDLEGFMAGYWKSPELTFFSGGAETKGWEPTLERYRRSYQAEGKEMGKLEMSHTQVVPLSPEAAYVLGHWHLTMSDGKTPHGLYTLILRKFPEGWRIIHDHTSASQ
jgi:beta-aspartyl-peptidase (threonine type)